MIAGLLILFPLICAMFIFLVKNEKWITGVALSGSIIQFLISLYGLFLYTQDCTCNLLLCLGTIPQLGVSLRFCIDGIGLLLILLTTFLMPLIILSSRRKKLLNPSAFYGLMMIMEMAFIGVFSTADGFLFYIFWELALIPAYFICAVWGGNDKIRITMKFFVYTFTGSLFMLIALIYIYFRSPYPHSFDFNFLYASVLTGQEQTWIFLAFFLAFAIKTPVFPFHTWQPETYTASPHGGTLILAGLMSKMGLYGFIRLVVPITPIALKELGFWVVSLIIFGILYASVIAIRQKNMKWLIAYSSIAHVGIIATGILTSTAIGLSGGVIQMISHGINIVGLFIILERIEERVKTTAISDLGGIAGQAPWLAVFFLIFLLGSIALPLTNGFVGEFMILLALFTYDHWLAFAAGLSVILSAVYMLQMYQRTMLGTINKITINVKDLSREEIITMIPLVIMVFWIGIFPGPFMMLAEPAITSILTFIHP